MDGVRSTGKPVRATDAGRPGAMHARQQPQAEPERTAFRPTPARPVNNKPSKRPLVIVGAIIAVLAVSGWFVWGAMRSSATAIDGSRYQAVFFTDGQAYFGKLSPLNDNYMKLRDIFYLQAPADEGQKSEDDASNPQRSTNTQGNSVQLIKLGEEVHGPDDEMVISRDQILFYENLKTDGKVAQSIEQYKSSH